MNRRPLPKARADFGDLKVHPFLASYPTMPHDQYQALVQDIAHHGLRQPIVLSADGSTIVDGRMRLGALSRTWSRTEFHPPAKIY